MQPTLAQPDPADELMTITVRQFLALVDMHNEATGAERKALAAVTPPPTLRASGRLTLLKGGRS